MRIAYKPLFPRAADLNVRTCADCGKRLRNTQTNICTDCLAIALEPDTKELPELEKDSEVYDC